MTSSPFKVVKDDIMTHAALFQVDKVWPHHSWQKPFVLISRQVVLPWRQPCRRGNKSDIGVVSSM